MACAATHRVIGPHLLCLVVTRWLSSGLVSFLRDLRGKYFTVFFAITFLLSGAASSKLLVTTSNVYQTLLGPGLGVFHILTHLILTTCCVIGTVITPLDRARD